jgi:hypothetical protein
MNAKRDLKSAAAETAIGNSQTRAAKNNKSLTFDEAMLISVADRLACFSKYAVSWMISWITCGLLGAEKHIAAANEQFSLCGAREKKKRQQAASKATHGQAEQKATTNQQSAAKRVRARQNKP